MSVPRSIKKIQNIFNKYLDDNPDFPWSICDASVEEGLKIAKELGIDAHAVCFDPRRLEEVTWSDMNPNHVWIQAGDWYFDPKHNRIYPVDGKHPYQPAHLIVRS